MLHKSPCALALVLVLTATNVGAQKRIGEPFALGVGESVLIIDAGIQVGFDHIASESRCPNGVLCVWEGNATARVWGEVSPDRTFFELNTNSQFRTEAPFAGFVIRLLNVAPYPEDGVVIDPDDYVTTMVVVREGPVPASGKTWGAIKALYRS